MKCCCTKNNSAAVSLYVNKNQIYFNDSFTNECSTLKQLEKSLYSDETKGTEDATGT